MPPMSITGQPNSARSWVTACLAASSFPAINMSGSSPVKLGLIITSACTTLRPLTTYPSGISRWMRSPNESVVPTNNPGCPEEKSSGSLASIMILPVKFSTPASRMTSSAALPRTDNTTSSPNWAASAKVPTCAPGPAWRNHPDNFVESREPIITGWPFCRNPVASVCPAGPEPRTPICSGCVIFLCYHKSLWVIHHPVLNKWFTRIAQLAAVARAQMAPRPRSNARPELATMPNISQIRSVSALDNAERSASNAASSPDSATRATAPSSTHAAWRERASTLTERKIAIANSGGAADQPGGQVGVHKVGEGALAGDSLVVADPQLG